METKEYENALDDLLNGIKEANEQGVGIVWGNKIIDEARAELAALRSRLSSADALLARLSNLENVSVDLPKLITDASEWREEGKK